MFEGQRHPHRQYFKSLSLLRRFGPFEKYQNNASKQSKDEISGALNHQVFQCKESVTNISNLSSTQTIFNIRHQHRRNHFNLTLISLSSPFHSDYFTRTLVFHSYPRFSNLNCRFEMTKCKNCSLVWMFQMMLHVLEVTHNN